jgi:hypothetical protein
VCLHSNLEQRNSNQQLQKVKTSNMHFFTSLIAPLLAVATVSGSVVKRQIANIYAPITTEELVKLCPLNDVFSSETAASCAAGVYSRFCTNPTDPVLLGQCHNAYNRIFELSFFKPIGDVCPAWRQGPRSAACVRAVSTFSYNVYTGKDPVTGQDMYTRLTSVHAAQLVQNILAQPKYAPCPYPSPICKWN